MFVRAYLRASTIEQDASRAREALEQFAVRHDRVIAAEYMENASGAKADRPELLRLLKDARKGDVLLVESIDRLSRLPAEDWQKLKAAIDSKGLRIVALDLPTSYQGIADTKGDEFTRRMLGAINSMLVEMMAAIARKDYEQRRERQAQGIKKAKDEGKYKGRPVDAALHKRVAELLRAGLGIRSSARHADCSTTTVLRIKREMEDDSNFSAAMPSRP
jgi:DNA invertase Pin-like site-specific DNA recombinase